MYQVVLAVDNDASQTGIKKAMQAAASFGGRAQAIQPEFTMTQIQQYQREKGLDATGNPQLPSDLTICIIWQALMQSKPQLMTYSGYLKSLRPQKRQSAAGNIRRYGTGHHGRARLRGMPLPPQPTTEAAEQAASSQPESIMPEHDHNQSTETTLQTASVQNNIEYDGTNQEQTPAAHYESD